MVACGTGVRYVYIDLMTFMIIIGREGLVCVDIVTDVAPTSPF